jgi:hypothetical protein
LEPKEPRLAVRHEKAYKIQNDNIRRTGKNGLKEEKKQCVRKKTRESLRERERE